MSKSTSNAYAADALSLAGLLDIGRQVNVVMNQVRASMLAPEHRKRAPYLTSADVMQMLSVGRAKPMTRNVFLNRIRDGVYPQPVARLSKEGHPEAGRRLHSLADVRAMLRTESVAFQRPAGALAKTITFVNSKGGVGKTTVAVSYAQRAARLGADVLFIDLDPQGSATSLLGMLPGVDVLANETVLSTMPHQDQRRKLLDIAKPTYWPGIDLVGANITLASVDLWLPNFMAEHPERAHEVYTTLTTSILEEAKSKYDLIVIDTPPAVSYLSLNALVAADGLVIPTGLSQVDFSASDGFWQMVAEAVPEIDASFPDKVYDFVRVVGNKTHHQGTGSVVRVWLEEAYLRRYSKNEMPDTRAMDSAGVLAIGTVYDLHGVRSLEKSNDDDARVDRGTLARAMNAFEDIGNEIDGLVRNAWEAGK